MLGASKELWSSRSTHGGDEQAGSPVACREGGWGGRAARNATEEWVPAAAERAGTQRNNGISTGFSQKMPIHHLRGPDGLFLSIPFLSPRHPLPRVRRSAVAAAPPTSIPLDCSTVPQRRAASCPRIPARLPGKA
jgi:hypothetical protein